MILSNVEIVRCLKEQCFSIEPLAGREPGAALFNTSTVDLRLASEIVVPDDGHPIQVDLSAGSISRFHQRNSKTYEITPEQPFCLRPNQFVLAKTVERVDFPLNNEQNYSARVEGKSSLARCGILVHFTAPTIHAGFKGTITLEIMNLGPNKFSLVPNMYICQLVIEEVKGCPVIAPSQFRGQSKAVGVIAS